MMIQSLWVSTVNQQRYPIHIRKNGLANATLFSPYIKSKQVLILSHPVIAKHYLPLLQQTCEKAGALQINYLSIPAGEKNKSLAYAERIWTALMKHHYHRDAVILALGGGVIGDLGGFCAGCYHRGIQFVQCPTSLIAQIDAAVGGKTAVNLAGIKNPVGLFYQPQAVIVDVNALHTLPHREYIAGLAELIKYGLGFDSAFFGWLETNIHLLLKKEPKALHYAIYQACILKAKVIALDTEDRHERLKLNLGHTVGHALEALTGSGSQPLRHGEAVAIGLVVAARLSLLRRNISQALLERLIHLFTIVGLPTQCPKGVTLKAIMHKIGFDKKHQYAQQRFVLLSALGHAEMVTDVIDAQLMTVLKQVGVPSS